MQFVWLNMINQPKNVSDGLTKHILPLIQADSRAEEKMKPTVTVICSIMKALLKVECKCDAWRGRGERGPGWPSGKAVLPSGHRRGSIPLLCLHFLLKTCALWTLSCDSFSPLMKH